MGKFLSLSFSIIGLAFLAACGSRQPTPVVIVPQPTAPVVNVPQTVTAPPVVQTAALRPGFGRIETIIRMDDGSMQTVDTSATGLSVGDRVELTREGYLRRHPPS